MTTPTRTSNDERDEPRSLLRRPPAERERTAKELFDRLDGPITALGVIFALIVLADTVARPTGTVATALNVAGWVIWAIFVAEFVLRMIIAPSTWGFLRRYWWQLIFLAVPFLRFARILARLRLARLGRVVSSAVRTSRTAGAKLSSRVGWLAAVTVIVVLASSQVLYEYARFDSYGDALHAAALATVTGEPTGSPSAVARVLEIGLAVYSVVVFASLAGILGAYFLEQRTDA